MPRTSTLITRLTKGQASQDCARMTSMLDDGPVETQALENETRERKRRLERLASSPTLAFLGVEDAALLFEALDARARQGFDDDHEDGALTGGRAPVQPPRRWIDEGSSRFAPSHGARSARNPL